MVLASKRALQFRAVSPEKGIRRVNAQPNLTRPRGLRNAEIIDELGRLGLLVEEPHKKSKTEKFLNGAKGVFAGIKAMVKRVKEITNGTDKRNAFRAVNAHLSEEVRTTAAGYRD